MSEPPCPGSRQTVYFPSGTQFDSDNDYIVIKQTNMTSLIIEMGFISNEKDVELYDDNMDDYAAAIANGIIEWLNEYQ